MLYNSNLKGKLVIFDGQEYLIEEPLGTGEFWWRARNVDDDSTKDISVATLRKIIKTYEKDVEEIKNKGIKALYGNGFVEIFINGKSEEVIGSEELNNISALLKLISKKFDIDLVEGNF